MKRPVGILSVLVVLFSACLALTSSSRAAFAASDWVDATPMMWAEGALGAAIGPDGLIYAVGGTGTPGTLNAVQVFSPTTNHWAQGAPTQDYRVNSSSVVSGDTLYVIGGRNVSTTGALSSVEAYSFATKTWAYVAPLPAPRSFAAAAALPDGRILVTGGTDGNIASASSWIYDPAGNSWTAAPPLDSPTTELAAAVGPDGHVYVMGGVSNGEELRRVESFNPATNAWTDVAPMATPRRLLAATTGGDGRVYAISGEDSASVESYYPGSTTWRPEASLPAPVNEAAAVAGIDDRIYLVGGNVLDPSTDLSSPSAQMLTLSVGDPTAWRPSTILPSPTDEQTFADVACPSATYCVAVGYSSPTEPYRTTSAPMAKMFTGLGWQDLAPLDPRPLGYSSANLTSVSCPDMVFCMLVGVVETPYSAQQGVIPYPLVETLQDGAWSMQVLSQTSGVLSSVSCVTTSHCVAVGTDGIATYDGTGWSVAGSPSGTVLSGVSCGALSDCVAVGRTVYNGVGTYAVALHFDGVRWSNNPVVSPSGFDGLASVSCPTVAGGAYCVAVGSSGNDTWTNQRGLVEVWANQQWTIMPMALPFASSTPYGWATVTCPAVSACVAGGVSFGAAGDEHALVANSGSTGWAASNAEEPGGSVQTGILGAGCAPSGIPCLAVGNWYDGQFDHAYALVGGIEPGTPTFTNASCAPDSTAVGVATTCTAVVSGGASPPTGIVTWSGPSGTFSDGGSCNLRADPDGSTSCSVAFTPGSGTALLSQPVALTAKYDGEATDPPSSGTASLSITKRPQTITFNPVGDHTYGDSPFIVAATSSDQLPISLSSSTSSCSASDHGDGTATVTIESTGMCTIVASQAGTDDDSPAQATQQIAIARATLTVVAALTRPFDTPNPALVPTISGFVYSDTGSNSVTGSASCSTPATALSPVGTYPITCSQGTLMANNYTFTFPVGSLTVTYTKVVTGSTSSSLKVASGQAVYVAAGASIGGSVTVQPGAELTIEGGNIAGGISAVGGSSAPIVAIRLCGTSVGGPIKVVGSSGLVTVGDDDGTSSCPGNQIIGSLTLQSNSQGVDVVGNRIGGSLTVTSNSGTLSPPDVGTVDVTGNQVSGRTSVQ